MHTRIKICGITTEADAEQATALGADMIGLNFYPQSPRYLDAGMAPTVIRCLPPHVEPVALFVHEPLGQAQQRARTLGIGTVQMHTDHREVLPAGTRWICAFAVRDAASLQAINVYLAMLAAVGAAPAALLVDAHVPGMFGGTGQVAPWKLLADYRPGVPLILAGGLTPDNVAEAIRIVRPFGVDVASGVEARPGKKDADKMKRFVDAVRGAQ